MLAVLLCGAVLSATVGVLQGGYQYHPELQRSVAQKKVLANWEEAKHICEYEGAVLASPITVELFHYMSLIIGVNNHTTAYFIGVKAKPSTENYKEFVSEEGILIDDMPVEVINEIEHLEPLHGDCLSMDRHGIRVVPCHVRLPYICYRNVTISSKMVPPLVPLTTTAVTTPTTEATTSTTASTSTSTTTARNICGEPGYTYYPTVGACYRHNVEPRTWEDAHRMCVSEGADLIVINSQAELEVVRSILTPLYALSYYYITWTGYKDQSGYGEWRTVHGEYWDQIYSVDSSNAPTRAADFKCCSSTINGHYEYPSCFTQYYFICEKRV